MSMTSSLRKAALIAHVVSSVGWFGAVAAFLALAIAGVRSDDEQLVRAAYLAMDVLTWTVIVPFCVASFVTGLAQSLGTSWGLFRHYWVAAKFLVTVIATVLLLVHTGPIGRAAAVAAQATASMGDIHQLRMQLIADSIGGLLALLFATALSVYKPFGMTSYGVRASLEATGLEGRLGLAGKSTPSTFWIRYALWGLLGMLLLLLAMHLLGGGHGH